MGKEYLTKDINLSIVDRNYKIFVKSWSIALDIRKEDI
jgi:hypothetical protein